MVMIEMNQLISYIGTKSADLVVLRVTRPLPRSVLPICLPINDRNDHGVGIVSGWPQYILNYLTVSSAVR